MVFTLSLPWGCSREEIPELSSRNFFVVGSDGKASMLLKSKPRVASIHVSEGEAVELMVSQQFVDVAVSFRDAGGIVTEVDLPRGQDGPEILCLAAPIPGRAELEIRAFEPNAASKVTVEVHARPLTAKLLACADALAQCLEGDRLMTSEQTGAARRSYLAALQSARRAERPLLGAVISFRLGSSHLRLGEREAGIEFLEQGQDAVRSFDRPALNATWRIRAGRILFNNDHYDLAEQHLRETARYAEAIGDKAQEAFVWILLGRAARSRSLAPLAARNYKKALAAYRRVGDPLGEAEAITDLASIYAMESRLPQAQALLNRALDLLPDEALDKRRKAFLQLGWVHFLAENPNGAIDAYDQGLALVDVRQTFERAGFLDRLGTAERQRKNYAVAEARYQDALSLLADPKSLSAANTYANLGELWLEQGRLVESEEALEKSREVFERVDQKGSLAHTQAALGMLASKRGDQDLALSRFELAIDFADTLWLEAFNKGELARPAALVQDIDQHYVDLLVAIGKGGRKELLKRAFERSDFARSRNLMALLQPPGGPSPTLGTLESMSLPAPPDLDALLRDWPSEVTLLSYVLGEPSSHLFVLSAEGFEVVQLADKASLESAAEAWGRLLSIPEQSYRSKRAGQRLSHLLLGPLRAKLVEGRRLIVVADGSLQKIPFAALPDRGGGTFLESFQVSQGPSVSVLSTLATKKRRQNRAKKRVLSPLVIIADPVYEPRDARFQRSESPLERVRVEGHQYVLERLKASGREAKAISELGAEPVLMLGFEANREAVLKEDLKRASILHFAVHSEWNARYPSESSIFLSQLNRDGETIPGRLTLSDIQRLKVGADLVVLSSCRSGVGEWARGDGAVGFAPAFFLAGATRLVASLWDVPDDATADLMTEFYRQMLEGGQAPVEALRLAQMDIRARPEYESPYFWAGFVLIESW